MTNEWMKIAVCLETLATSGYFEIFVYDTASPASSLVIGSLSLNAAAVSIHSRESTFTIDLTLHARGVAFPARRNADALWHIMDIMVHICVKVA